MVNTTIPVLKVRNTGIVICDDQEARDKRIAPQLAQCKGKGKAPCCATGKERLTPSNVLQILKERNGGVIIREDKGNGKPPCHANGKENQAPNGSVISNVAAAQRAQMEREKMSNIVPSSKAALAQQARRQRELNYSLQILKERNGGVVIREDKGKGKPPCQANGKENQAPNGSVISKAAAAQRARREREKMSNIVPPSKAALAQQARRQRELNYSPWRRRLMKLILNDEDVIF